MGVRKAGKRFHRPPLGKLGRKNKNSRKPEGSSLIPNKLIYLLQWQFIFRYDTDTAQEPGSLFWCHAVTTHELAFHSCPLLCLQRHVAKLASSLFYCWALLRNNTVATNLHVFTSSYGSRRSAACKRWTQVMHSLQGDSEFW